MLIGVLCICSKASFSLDTANIILFTSKKNVLAIPYPELKANVSVCRAYFFVTRQQLFYDVKALRR